MSRDEAQNGLYNQQIDMPQPSHHWQVVSASVTGTSHEERGQPCQDANNYATRSDGILVAAVADGAGSAALSEVGAGVAVRSAVETIRKLMATPAPIDETEWKLLLTDVLKAARKSVEAEASVHQVKVRDLASTLIVVAATPELVAVAQVGDGAAIVEDTQGNIIALTTPQCGEYINQTTFLVSDSAVETAQVKLWRGNPVHLAVLSDGLQMLALKMPEATPHAPFFSPLFRFVAEVTDKTVAKEQLVSFLKSSRVTQRTDDDLTILLATWVE